MSYDIPEDKLTMSLCLYQTQYGNFLESREGFAEKNPEYVCVSEPITVTFTPLDPDKVLQARVAALDNEIEKVRAEASRKIDDLKDQKQRLLAITHDGESAE